MKKFFFLLLILGFLSLAGSASSIELKNPLGGTDSFEKLISKITDYVVGVISVLVILMFLIAGILFVISAGNPQRIDQAKKAAIYAAIGAAIALAGKGLIELIKTIIGT